MTFEPFGHDMIDKIKINLEIKLEMSQYNFDGTAP